ncbi:hypothetical protein AB4Y43_06910 [Paraburkholderia sp. BR10872]|uniref:hypothetical protein n=1 Tax=Paraburkholderia sp. BR10872 TaxID=3236989 RepID=UPI0034D1D702
MDDHDKARSKHLQNSIDFAQRRIDELDPNDPEQGHYRRALEEKVKQWKEWQKGKPPLTEEQKSRNRAVIASTDDEIQKFRERIASLEKQLEAETNQSWRQSVEHEIHILANNIAGLERLNDMLKEELAG